MAQSMNQKIKMEDEPIDVDTQGADEKDAGGTSYTGFDGGTYYFPEPFFLLETPDQAGIAYYVIERSSDLQMKLYNQGGDELPRSAELKIMKEDARGKNEVRISRNFKYAKWRKLSSTEQMSSDQDVSLADILLNDREVVKEGQKLKVYVIDSNTIDVDNADHEFTIYGKVGVKQGI